MRQYEFKVGLEARECELISSKLSLMWSVYDKNHMSELWIENEIFAVV